MKTFIILLVVSILYAFIRSRHDSYLREGKWKVWAFVEGVLFAFSLSFCLTDVWWFVGVCMLVFWITFWITFDSLMGLIFNKSILYLGETGWDKELRQIFQYATKGKGIQLYIVRIVILISIYGTYWTCYNLYIK